MARFVDSMIVGICCTESQCLSPKRISAAWPDILLFRLECACFSTANFLLFRTFSLVVQRDEMWTRFWLRVLSASLVLKHPLTEAASWRSEYALLSGQDAADR